MSADWDVFIEIQESLKSLPGLVRQHVRGHQDLHTPYRKLSLLAQLNVDADHQASRYKRLYGAERPIAFLMPPMTCDPKTSRLDKLGKPSHGKTGGEGVRNYSIKQMNALQSYIGSDIMYAIGNYTERAKAQMVCTLS